MNSIIKDALVVVAAKDISSYIRGKYGGPYNSIICGEHLFNKEQRQLNKNLG